MNANEVINAWMEVFPNSTASAKSVLGSTCVALHLLPASECANRIQENDPLNYAMWIEGDNLREDRLNVLTRPPKGSNLVYGSAKMRKQTIKNADYDKLVRRFNKVREWVMNQDLAHDVSGK